VTTDGDRAAPVVIAAGFALMERMPGDPPIRLEQLDGSADGRRFSPSAGRNQQHIVDALVELLPDRGVCLEVASGTGEHGVLAATRLPKWRWIPSERDADALVSIEAWVEHAGLANLDRPRRLDLGDPWPFEPESLDAVFASNLMHIAPMETTDALFRGAARHLKRGASLLVYGAVFLPGTQRPEGNRGFDADLRARDPRYGVRELTTLARIAARAGLGAPQVRSMPADNVILRLPKP
jgi:hypothetical protein